jgi:hypothetical protein
MTTLAFINPHAIGRYLERVDPDLTRAQAATAIRTIEASARRRPAPRHWTAVPAHPGSRYLYSAQHPGICLVERDGRIRTVFQRETSRRWRHAERNDHRPTDGA